MAEIRIERRRQRTLPAMVAAVALLLGLLLWGRHRSDHIAESAGAVDTVQTSAGDAGAGPAR